LASPPFLDDRTAGISTFDKNHFQEVLDKQPGVCYITIATPELGPFLFILHCRRTAIAAVLRLPPYCDCRRTAIAAVLRLLRIT
jgi:hypothetical protein